MDYELQWGTDKPGHIVFLIDLSGSMDDKIDYVIESVQKTCQNILTRCVSGTTIKERVCISAYGYNYRVVNLFKTNPASMRDIALLLKQSRVSGQPIFDKNNEAKPEYQTRMQMAFEKAKDDIEHWVSEQQQKGFSKIPAPIVINITDGYPYEGKEYVQKDVFSNTLSAAKELMSVRTMDGNVRIFNVHYDPSSRDATLRFPKSRPSGEELQFLYDASSPMSDDLISAAKNYGFEEAEIGSKCMISNEKEVSKLASFIEWGSSK